jgi:DeoR family fructose operon transcriptional repressor
MINSMKNKTPSYRYSVIQRQLLMDGTVSVESLAQNLHVSVATIRRDLTQLEKSGNVLRTHGGATIAEQRGAVKAFAIREQIDADAKRSIAREALELIETDQTLFMNDGTTMMALANELVASEMALTVITNGVNIATALSENPNIVTYLAGGLVRHRTLGTTGDFAEQMLSTFNADIALIATEGFSIADGLTHSYETDAKIARIMDARATQTIVLTTARKLSQRDRILGIAASRVDILVTDCQHQDIVEPIRNSGISVFIAEDENSDNDSGQVLPLSSL